MSVPSEETKVVRRLAERGLNATKDAVEHIANSNTPDEVVRRLSSEYSDQPVVTVEHVRDCTDSPHEPSDSKTPSRSSETSQSSSSTPSTSSRPSRTSDTSTSTNKPSPSDTSESERTPSPGSSRNRSVEVTNDITGESTCTGVYTDFVDLFRDRFERLSGMLRSRLSPRTVESVKSGGRGSVTVVGMVNDVRSTSSGNRLVEIEDTTGSIRALFSDDEHLAEVETIVSDEVIGVEGRLSDDGGLIFVDNLHFPDVPPRREPNTASRDVEAVLVSDIHVGSDSFVAEKWHAFTDWLSTQDDVEYVLVAGDLVEGVGVYPGQDEELTVVDIYDQYEECAEYFKQIPDDIDVISITGNHDSVRLAEPQPALGDDFREPFDSNVRFVGNPSTVELEGVSIMMYHGVSLNAFVEELPGARVEDPETAMLPMLRKRHLAPMYGRVRLAPEETDYMVIDEVPDVLHTGHVHTIGADRYNSVTMVNTGAWQSQTDYQKAVNIQPDVGYAAVINLGTLDTEFRSF